MENAGFLSPRPDFRTSSLFSRHAAQPGVRRLRRLAELDNYDLSPPSVRFLNPFTREPYSRANLPEFLQRPQMPPNVAVPPGTQVLIKGPPAVMFQEPQGETGEAFFCMQGVREYHSHPAHTGDPWVPLRGTGKGTLFQILDQLHEFGITILKSYNMNLQIQINGYQSGWSWQA